MKKKIKLILFALMPFVICNLFLLNVELDLKSSVIIYVFLLLFLIGLSVTIYDATEQR